MSRRRIEDSAAPSPARHGSPRRTHPWLTGLVVVIGLVVSVWIVASPTTHSPRAAGAQPPRPVAPAGQDQSPEADRQPRPSATTPRVTVDTSRWKYANRCPDTAFACVDLHDHVSWLQHGGVVLYGPVRIEPGSPGQPTPRGTFAVDRKDKHHVSNEYNEPMPDAVFFAPGGIAFHVGSLTMGSHGCVHLSTRDADSYYNQLGIGAQVVVF